MKRFSPSTNVSFVFLFILILVGFLFKTFTSIRLPPSVAGCFLLGGLVLSLIFSFLLKREGQRKSPSRYVFNWCYLYLIIALTMMSWSLLFVRL